MFLLANARYLTLSNKELHDLAQGIASSGERGEGYECVLAQTTAMIDTNNIPFSASRLADPKTYRALPRRKNKIISFPWNAPGRVLAQRV